MKDLKFNLNDYLRFAFAGGWFIVAMIIMYPDKALSLIEKNTLGFILFSLIVGSLIYSIHRALIFPILYLILLITDRKYKNDKKLLFPYYPSDTEVRLDMKRWKDRKNRYSVSGNLVDWSSQIHFLYCTSWALLSAVLVANYIGEYQLVAYNLVFFLFWLAILASVVSHWRHFIFEAKIAKEEKDKLS